MDSRAKNSVRNIVAGIVNKIVLIALPFLVRTVMVKVLGSDYLGLSSLFTSILTVLNLTELGFGSALVFSMYKPIAENDEEKICALFSIYAKIYKVIGTVLLSVGFVLMPFLPHLINGDCPTDVNLYILYIIYLGNTCISYFAFAYKKALLTAYQRSDIISNINTAISIILYGLQIALLLTVKNYYIYAIVFPICTLAENLYTSFVVTKKYPNIIRKGSITKEEKSEIKNHVKGIALQKICSTSRNSFDSIVISMYFGLTTIAIYNNYFYILSAVHNFLYQIPDSIRASVGNSVASESVDKNFDNFNVMTFIYMWISGFCCICLICLYQPFMVLWMGEKMILPLKSVILFCVYFFELSLADILALYKDGAGLWWHGRYRTLIEAVMNLLLNFVLGYFWGVNGILLATIISLCLIGLGYGGYIVFHYYFQGKNYLKYIGLQLLYFIITFAASTATYYVCNYFKLGGFIGLFCKGIVCIILGNFLLWIMLRNLRVYPKAKIFVKDVFKTVNLKARA